MRDAPDRLTPPAADAQALRRTDPILAMAAEPWRFDFFQAMRAIEAFHRHKPRLGTRRKPADEPVRLGQAADLSFAPASLHAVSAATARSPARIEVRFFGLFGPNGPLPFNLTEHARERLLHHGDATFARFADMFHHRMLLLFYRAWAQAQPVVSLDRPGDERYANIVGSLIGIGTPRLRHRDAAPDHAKLYFAGLLSRQVRNAAGLESLLSGYLRRPVRVEQFVGAWLPLQPAERSRLGRLVGGRRNLSARLGGGAVLGGTVWDRQHNFRVHIGPLSREAFEALLPDGKALPAVVALVQQYVGHEFGWDLQLGHVAPEIKPAQLGRHGRLGWTSWVRHERQAGVAELVLSPAAALRKAAHRHSTDSPPNPLH